MYGLLTHNFWFIHSIFLKLQKYAKNCYKYKTNAFDLGENLVHNPWGLSGLTWALAKSSSFFRFVFIQLKVEGCRGFVYMGWLRGMHAFNSIQMWTLGWLCLIFLCLSCSSTTPHISDVHRVLPSTPCGTNVSWPSTGRGRHWSWQPKVFSCVVHCNSWYECYKDHSDWPMAVRGRGMSGVALADEKPPLLEVLPIGVLV